MNDDIIKTRQERRQATGKQEGRDGRKVVEHEIHGHEGNRKDVGGSCDAPLFVVLTFVVAGLSCVGKHSVSQDNMVLCCKLPQADIVASTS